MVAYKGFSVHDIGEMASFRAKKLKGVPGGMSMSQSSAELPGLPRPSRKAEVPPGALPNRVTATTYPSDPPSRDGVWSCLRHRGHDACGHHGRGVIVGRVVTQPGDQLIPRIGDIVGEFLAHLG